MTAAPAFASISTPQTGAANTLAVNMPPSLVAGLDRVIVVWLRHSSASLAITGPAGWNALAGVNSLNNTSIFWRRVDGSETASYTFTAAAVQTISDAVAVQYSGCIRTGVPVDVVNALRDIAGTNAVSVIINLTTTVANTRLAYCDMKNAASRTRTIDPTGMTLRTAAASATHIWDMAQAAIGATGNKQATYSAASLHYSSMLALKGPPDQSVAATGFDVAVTFGTPTLTQDQFVNPAGFAPAVEFGTPALSQGVQASGFDMAVQFGTPSLAPDQIVTVDGFDLAVQFGSPNVRLSVEPDGFDLPIEFGSPGVYPDNVVHPDGFDLALLFGSPTVVRTPTVAGTVYDHETGLAVGAGVLVELFDENNTLIDTTTTDGSGAYLFSVPIGTTLEYFTVARVSDTVQGVSQVCEPLP